MRPAEARGGGSRDEGTRRRRGGKSREAKTDEHEAKEKCTKCIEYSCLPLAGNFGGLFLSLLWLPFKITSPFAANTAEENELEGIKRNISVRYNNC